MTPIGQNVKRLRTVAGMTQMELAVAAGMNVVVVSKIEQGAVPDPRASTLIALARALGTTTDALVAEAESEGPSSITPPESKPAQAQEPEDKPANQTRSRGKGKK